MKGLFWIMAGVTALILAFVVVQTAASERIEVVELHTVDNEGAERTTRLWIVDFEGYPYIRAGDERAGWYGRLRDAQTIRLTRGGVTKSYLANPVEGVRNDVNRLMREKYTWGDAFFENVFDNRATAIPIRLSSVPGGEQG